MKKAALGILFLLCGFLLCSCVSLPVTDAIPQETLPPTEVTYAAPIGDSGMEYTSTMQLYLPNADGISLSTVTADVAFSPAQTQAESLLRALMSQKGNGETTALGGTFRLALYGKNPVTVSHGTVTVNLSPSTLQLKRDKFYIACQAITNTLTQLDSVDSVNILIAGKAQGLDTAGALPMGALKASDATDQKAVYQSLLSQKAKEGQTDPTFTANVTLFFPLENSEGLVCETRSIVFDSQTVPDMVMTILQEIAAGPSDSLIRSPALPILPTLLTSTPSVAEDDEAGGSVLVLDFAHNLYDMVEAYHLDMTQSSRALCATFCTFFPNLNGLRMGIKGYESEEQSAEKVGEETRSLTLFSDIGSLIYNYCTLWFPQKEDETLCMVTRPVPCATVSNPRALLLELTKGPQSVDSRTDTLPLLPQDVLKDASILGFSLEGSTLLVNFKAGFAKNMLSEMTASEKSMAYAMTNTLCVDPVVKSVCFFDGGSQFDGNGIYWRGLFYPMN